MYVERLTKDMERLTQQIAMYEAQTNAQAEETQAAKEAFSEVTAVWHKTHTTTSVHLCNNSFYNQLLLISAINQAENSCLIIRLNICLCQIISVSVCRPRWKWSLW